ncbi:hypothetical protein CI109_101436 [Kwoniella shandongensis]|uniref:Uncharacterized protein n=1 Tax=Kwoniella shandongensis TaxID=1734106 RepID=A0AAJ8MTJ2_9TREE
MDLLVNPSDEISKDAYMLVYKRRDGKTEPNPPPPIVLNRVIADNAALHRERAEHGAKREALLDEFDHIKGAKLETDHIVPRDALANWIQAASYADLLLPFDMSPLLCDHGGIDPAKTSESRLISDRAFDKLQSYTELPDLDICQVCVEDEFKERLSQAATDAQVQTFDSFDSMSDLADEWIVPKMWLEQWRRGSLPDGTLPTNAEYTLFCEHGKRAPNERNSTISISPEALAYLKSTIGDFEAFQEDEPECEVCLQSVMLDRDNEAAWRLDVKVDRMIKRGLNPKPPAFGIDYFALSEIFVKNWFEYMKTPGPRPMLEMGLCEHGMLDYDPQTEKPDILEQSKWTKLCDKYGRPEREIVVQFGSNPLPGKRNNITYFSPKVCEPCHVAK